MLNLADVVLRVGRAYGMTADHGIYQAVAVQDGRITAVGRSRDELDSFIGPGTAVIDDPELALYPAFNDTHNHQLLAARDLDYVSLEQARSIDELVAALRGAADRTPSGEWVISSRCWHETHLREGRLPTARELDAASASHPVFVQRGGHVGVANSSALRMAGITATSGDPPSGTVVRLGDGTPVGVLIEGGALEPVRRLLPSVSEVQQAELLARQCRLYNRRGIGVVRDPGLVPGEVAVYQAVADRGELTTRTRLMFWVMPQATVADTLAYIDSLPEPGSVGGDGGGLGIWGLKLGMDGGVEGGFLDEPYANNPAFRGHAFWEPDDFGQVVEHAVGRGWRVGCHAVGDGAVRRVLDAYEQVARRQPGAVLGPGPRQPGHAGPGLGRRGGADRGRQRLQRQLLRPAAVHLGSGHPRHAHGGSPGSGVPGGHLHGHRALHRGRRPAARRGPRHRDPGPRRVRRYRGVPRRPAGRPGRRPAIPAARADAGRRPAGARPRRPARRRRAAVRTGARGRESCPGYGIP